MLIYTPRASFEHTEIVGIGVLSGIYGSTAAPIRPRLSVKVKGDVHIFYGELASSVLAQMKTAGVLTLEQAQDTSAALADEQAMFDAATAAGED